jgi:hypothetical protein
MVMRMRAVAIVLLVAACGDNLRGIELDDYPAERRAASCRYLVKCGIFRTYADCEVANVGVFEFSPSFHRAIAAGRIRWNHEAVYQCLQRAGELSCDRGDDDRNWTCDAPMWEGTLAEGEACTSGAECISRECWTNDCTDACCSGTCVGREPPKNGRIGEGCRYSGCIEGYCDGNACQPRLVAGARCLRDQECIEGLACVNATCMELPDSNESCINECRQVGAHCSVLSYTCRPLGLLGDPCGHDGECSPYYACGAEKRCAVPELPDGSRCSFDGPRCTGPGSFCSSESVCTPPTPPIDCDPD